MSTSTPTAFDPAVSRVHAPSVGSVVYGPVAVPRPSLNYYWGSLALAAVAVLALGGAAALKIYAIDADGAVLTFAIIGLLAAVPAAILFVQRARKACTIASHERGISVSRGSSTTAIAFDEIDSLIVREKLKLNNGVAAGLERTIVVKGSGRTATIQHFAQTEDLTVTFTRALISGHVDAVAKKTGSGAALAGDGWTLSARGLECKAGAVPVSTITGCAEVDGRMQFWRGNETEPFLSIPAISSNAFTLLAIASEHISDRPSVETSQDAEGLGRLLFQRRQSVLGSILAAIIALPLLILGVGLVFESPDPENRLFAICFALIGGVILIAGVWAISSRRRFYERGLIVRSIFGSKTMLYRDVVKFSWTATRQYVNGGYAGTSMKAKLVAEDGRTLTLGFSVSGQDEALDDVRQQIAAAVSERMLAAIARGERVPWGKSAILLSDCIEHHLPKLIGKGELRRTPYTGGLTYEFKEGTFHLFSPNDRKAILTMSCAEENFWPGLLVMVERAGD